jgi:hypothetical protein
MVVENIEGKRLLGRFRSRWEDNIIIYLKEIRCEGVDWIHLAQDKVWRHCLVKKRGIY